MLLEVVLALALFFVGALVVLGGLNSALQTAQRVQLEAQAGDLGVSLLSEVQLGLVPLVDDGPREYEDTQLAGWTWQVIADPAEQSTVLLDLPEVTRVEIVIRHESSAYAYRLVELVTAEGQAAAAGTGAAPEEPLEEP